MCSIEEKKKHTRENRHEIATCCFSWLVCYIWIDRIWTYIHEKKTHMHAHRQIWHSLLWTEFSFVFETSNSLIIAQISFLIDRFKRRVQLILIVIVWRNDRNYRRKQKKTTTTTIEISVNNKRRTKFQIHYQLNRGQLYAPVNMTIVYLYLFDLITKIDIQITKNTVLVTQILLFNPSLFWQNRNLHKPNRLLWNNLYNTIVQLADQTFFKILLVLLLLFGLCI